jgi:hypothetical protein
MQYSFAKFSCSLTLPLLYGRMTHVVVVSSFSMDDCLSSCTV